MPGCPASRLPRLWACHTSTFAWLVQEKKSQTNRVEESRDDKGGCPEAGGFMFADVHHLHTLRSVLALQGPGRTLTLSRMLLMRVRRAGKVSVCRAWDGFTFQTATRSPSTARVRLLRRVRTTPTRVWSHLLLCTQHAHAGARVFMAQGRPPARTLRCHDATHTSAGGAGGSAVTSSGGVVYGYPEEVPYTNHEHPPDLNTGIPALCHSAACRAGPGFPAIGLGGW